MASIVLENPDSAFVMQHTSQQEIRAAVDRIMIEEFEVDPEALRPDARLADDLDLDSLDGVDLVVALEKTFSCRIPEEQARGIRTLGDIYARVTEGLRSQLQERAS